MTMEPPVIPHRRWRGRARSEASAFSVFRPRPRTRLPIDARGAAGYGRIMDYRAIITIEPGKRGGKPVIRGLRITVDDVLSYLASGMSVDEIVADFPSLTVDDVRAVLAYAADRERQIATTAG